MRNIQESISRLDTAISRHDGLCDDVTQIPKPIRDQILNRLIKKYIDSLSSSEGINLLMRADYLRDLSDSEIIQYKSGIQDKAEYIAVSAAGWLLNHSQYMDKLMDSDKE